MKYTQDARVNTRRNHIINVTAARTTSVNQRSQTSISQTHELGKRTAFSVG